MSQYQPVSLNTIRAAIMWGGLPTPRLKQVWCFAPPNRPPWSTVLATFSLAEVTRKYSPRPRRYTGPDDLVPFRRQLSGCFSTDITVVGVYVRHAKDELVAMLACSVEDDHPDGVFDQALKDDKFRAAGGASWLDPVDPFPLHDRNE